MTGLHTALQTFWSQFAYGTAIPAYPSDNVPDTAVYPYITYEVTQGAYFGATVLTAFVWVKKTGAWAAKRAAILDAIAEAIPEEGAKISFAGGNARLRRNDAGFMSYYDDPADASIAGGRVSYEITYYVL